MASAPVRDTRWPGEDGVYVEWGRALCQASGKAYPDLERPPQVALSVGWVADPGQWRLVLSADPHGKRAGSRQAARFR